ncbi:hypothetical protein [Sphingopyxis sp. MSC1_008]|uniref:hypothetical protein n=1 Tax=Sphingopyxis sp. MSC1_008 TaxID=2909265 RepID=UPI0020BDCE7D|nr:hypothetical protein [Sphingopyxis sp. MSC1_008]
MSRSRRAEALDRSGAFIRKLIEFAALLLGVAATRADAPPAFEQLRWTAPGSELALLSEQPATCLAADDDALVRSGRALFGAPTLLGGQAAKAGLSCASCHINGRGNPHFLLAGVSAAPGTADVTNSFFSAARGNGRFDPVTIPDLAMPGKVARGTDTRALEAFVRNLIVEEFGGQEPTPAMLDALATYVRAVRACPGEPSVGRRLDDQLSAIDDGVAGTRLMIDRGDPQGARLAIAAMRHQLGLIAERYTGPRLAREREGLLAASRALQAIGEDNTARIGPALARWKSDFDTGLAKRLRRAEARSLYDANRLAESLRQFAPSAIMLRRSTHSVRGAAFRGAPGAAPFQ